MLINKYRPFRQKTEELNITLREKIKQIQGQIVIMKVEDKTGLLIKTELISPSVMIIGENGEVKFSDKIGKSATSIAIMGESKAVLFNVTSLQFTIYDAAELKCENIARQKQQEWEESQFSLQYFKQASLVCLIQKNKLKEKVRVTYHEYKDGILNEVNEYVSEEGQWKDGVSIYKVNEEGLLGWCNVDSQYINVSFYSHEGGFRTINEIQNICGGEVIVREMANWNSNLIHLALEYDNNNTSSLPLVILETGNNFSSLINQPRLVSQGKSSKQIQYITKAFTIGRFMILKDAAEKDKVLIYSLENEEILDEYFALSKQNSSISVNNAIESSGLIEWNYDTNDCQQIAATIYSLHRVNSLSVLKLLESIQKVREYSKSHETVVLIFGAHLSGKSTLRHFLCGEELVHVQNEAGYFEVKVKNAKESEYPEELQRDRIISISQTKQAIIIEIPDWNHEEFFEVQVVLVMQEVFKSFAKMHTILAIPDEEVSDSTKNAEIFSSVLKMVSYPQNEDPSQSISIILTKIEDEDTLDQFTDRIEEISEVNPQNENIGVILTDINGRGGIYVFENKEHSVEKAKEFLEEILDTAQKINEEMKTMIKQKLGDERFPQPVRLIVKEVEFYYTMMNKLLTYFSHIAANSPAHFDVSYFTGEVFHLPKLTNTKKNGETLAVSLFKVLSCLKLFAEKQQNQKKEQMVEIAARFNSLAEQFKEIASEEEYSFVQTAIACFMTALILPSECLLISQGGQPYLLAIQILKNKPNSCLGKRFKSIIRSLSEKSAEVKSSAQMPLLLPYIGSEERVVITKTVAMSYQQQKAYYLKKSNILEVICSLPSNAMKLDLVIEELMLFGREGLSDKNFRQTKFYIRQASRICQFHKLYYEAIVFLMVIPDFICIDALLDEMVNYRKGTVSYENKKIFTNLECEMLDDLISIGRDCARERLVRKAIFLRFLNVEASSKSTDLKNNENKHMKKELPKDQTYKAYFQKLESKTDLPFCNLKNDAFKKMIERRGSIIEQCREYEDSKITKKAYESVEALNWVVESLPIPI